LQAGKSSARRQFIEMGRLAVISLAVFLIAAVSPAPAAQGTRPKRDEPCSSYRPHMEAARADLVRGDRAKAIEDLEVARAALKSCRRLHRGSRRALAMAE
jgi:hypothetical protein